MKTPLLRPKPLHGALAALLLAAASTASAPVHADGGPSTPPRLDRSGHKRVGMASYYAQRFAGRKMADGTPMRPESDNAASTTLPLGTVALVTNLGNGRFALVTIRDRGPYAKGRIIDLSPRTAAHLGMIEAGVTRVEVTPLRVPPPTQRPGTVVALADPRG
jgi:rare lipoprotein A